MKSNKLLYGLAIGVLLVNILTLAALWRKPHPPGGGRPGGREGGGSQEIMRIFTESLHWNDAQIKQFEALRMEHFTQTKALMDSSRIWHDQYFSFLGKAPASDDRLEALATKIANVEKEKTTVTFDHFSKVRAICTPEQQQKFDEIIQQTIRTAFGPRAPGPPPNQLKGNQ